MLAERRVGEVDLQLEQESNATGNEHWEQITGVARLDHKAGLRQRSFRSGGNLFPLENTALFIPEAWRL